MNRVEVRSSVLSCTLCSLHLSCRSPVPFRGPSPATLAIVAEAPGRTEDEEGKPLVGPSGKKVEEWLTRARIDPSTVAYLNAVSCFPNRTPSAQEVEICRTNLTNQLTVIQPTFMLVLGGVALSSFWKSLRMGDARGRWWKATIPSLTDTKPRRVWALATYHPAAVLRNGSLDGVVMSDIMKMKIALTIGSPPTIHPDYRCVMCGALVDKLRMHDDEDVTESIDCEGSLGWCEKHDGLRMGTKGGGRQTTKPASKAGTKGSASTPRKKSSASSKRSNESGPGQGAFNLDKYRVK